MNELTVMYFIEGKSLNLKSLVNVTQYGQRALSFV